MFRFKNAKFAGVSTARTQQAGPSRGQAAWDYLGDSAKFLVESLEFGISGPGIWMMSEQRRGPLRFSRNFGAGPVNFLGMGVV
ncbi:hypothetical protein L3X38_022567 [Prunus dulcis]|uniref:Uncharacterized protein n=1 Tax=Prunus dulcis TaxID=3755 RepID=A0AAD4Z5A7_PRUDU|nr:hypothetical protein L3X38_022567 [Prunus dulcis]